MPVVACFTLSQPQDVSAFSSDSISQGNTPIAISTPGGAGQSTLPITSLSLAGSNQANNPLATTLPYSQSNTQSVPNTNTSQNSSWLSAIEGYPGDIASTALNLINWGITPPGYTPGGLPTEYKVLSGPVGFGPTTYWLRASRSDQTELRAHATSIN